MSDYEDDPPEDLALRARWAEEMAREAAARARQERAWATLYPAEWEEWVRVRPLMNLFFEFGADKLFDFDDFLREVGRRPSAKHSVR